VGLVQVILGPRQVGKTTTTLKLLEEHYHSNSMYVSADRVFNPDHGWLRSNWQLALQEQKILVIDEIQKCFNWAESIKALYDEAKREKRQCTCVLLGSSSLEIQRGLSETLTGRFQLIRIPHWNFAESQLGYGLSFDDYLHYGGYPGSYEMIGTSDWYDYVKNSIVSTVVERDILQFSKVKNPALFRQAFELLISYPAQEISYTKLLGQLQDRGNVELIKHYISLYEGAYLIKTLEKFSLKAIKVKSSSPKIIPLAPALAYLPIRSRLSTEERGRAFEALVGAQLLRTGEDLFYWREGNSEVDFVLKKGRALWGIEVKSGRKKSVTGLDAFKRRYPSARGIVVTVDNYQSFERNPMEFLEG
jgi:predicted AAA+ superfamily ATPase